MQLIDLGKIVADPKQPRKYFDADKMHSLKESIKKKGIKVPLNVQDLGNGKYLLEDGERRFRAATELKLKEVPVVISKKTSDTERLVNQFHLQQQHEDWSPLEKAVAISDLSDELSLSVSETCKMLGLTDRDIKRFSAFVELVDKTSYSRSEIPLDYAQNFIGLRTLVEKIYFTVLNKEFDRNLKKKLEHRLIASVLDGTITKRGDIVRLKDTFTKNPKLVEKYLTDSKVSPASLYLTSGAQGATALRNAVLSAQYLTGNGEKFLKIKDVKINEDQLVKFKRAQKTLKSLIDLAE